MLNADEGIGSKEAQVLKLSVPLLVWVAVLAYRSIH